MNIFSLDDVPQSYVHAPDPEKRDFLHEVGCVHPALVVVQGKSLAYPITQLVLRDDFF